MASNLRVVVSNLGDGNWTAPANTLNNTDPDIYFPPGVAKGDVPIITANGFAPSANSSDLIGFTSKTQWMVQINASHIGTGGVPGISVYAVRPTGIEDLIVTFVPTVFPAQESYGGVTSAAEGPIEGPVSYFKFESNATTNTSLDVDCYVIGWNYGDISDGATIK
tara:strand:- start:242 stop:736 length:495 start_codon:yes stop_codon:yes gene_type:complete